MSKHVLQARIARRLPDPNHAGIERHVFFSRLADTPRDLPRDPNARSQNISRRIYRDVESSMLAQDDGTFHLKHKGITVVASAVEKLSEDRYSITLEEGEGIVDGAHSYELITKHLDSEDLPEDQYIKWEVLVNAPQDWIADISGGLNTSVQVQEMSLENLKGNFDWMKKLLKDEPFADAIAWRENEPGEFDARDVVAVLTLFNVHAYPNQSDDQPIIAYASKAKALRAFQESPKEYERLRKLLPEALLLHDTIRYTARSHWNDAGGKAGSFTFVESRKRGEYAFPFIQKSGKYRLMNGALYPILGSFRWMVDIEEESGLAVWRGGFESVLARWEQSAPELVAIVAQQNKELGRNPQTLGKSKSLWSALHKAVAFRDLTSDSG